MTFKNNANKLLCNFYLSYKKTKLKRLNKNKSTSFFIIIITVYRDECEAYLRRVI